MKALAELVRDSRDGDCMITTIPNPRVESASHSYKVATDNFRELYPAPKVTLDMEVVIVQAMLEKYREQLEEVRAQIAPKTEWRAGA